MIKYKKVILIDLDGVLNEYTGNFDKNYIPSIKNGAREFLANLSKEYEIKIFTTRNKLIAAKWVYENKLEKYISDITSEKQLAWLYIDDRSVTFNGNYKDLKEEIDNFTVWYKK